ncbi:hypothetical protein POPTR_001G252104v4 [Populus trichocarpa]|uniref:Uncharacterized protein n=1 Tax=Populus trichocarpa TaxID=3694 RepID=A0ACC0TL64_POPTR|nr:hypothetical protein POPTR_001G252104v4 [Populus trichocarpa]
MFRANGGCGCVKKPGFSLSEPDSDPSVQLTVEKILKVKIYFGAGWHLDFRCTHFDLYSPPDFFARDVQWAVRLVVVRASWPGHPRK